MVHQCSISTHKSKIRRESYSHPPGWEASTLTKQLASQILIPAWQGIYLGEPFSRISFLTEMHAATIRKRVTNLAINVTLKYQLLTESSVFFMPNERNKKIKLYINLLVFNWFFSALEFAEPGSEQGLVRELGLAKDVPDLQEGEPSRLRHHRQVHQAKQAFHYCRGGIYKEVKSR